jgi:hypothetical protein
MELSLDHWIERHVCSGQLLTLYSIHISKKYDQKN